MISKETIEEIKSRAKLFDIVSETVALKRQGSSLTGLCPFHSERTPSFHVREDSNHYHCFGCGASGNVFSFIMETRGLSFPEAIEELAGRLGIEVKYDGKREKSEPYVDRELLYKVNRHAAQYFASNLEKAPNVVKQYVASRGLTSEAIKAFAIGFAPEGRDTLAQLLRKQKVTEEIMLQTGLVRRGQNGELYDTFRSRLVFPVSIDTRRIAGFGGRIIPELLSKEQRDTLPKYLNSPETPIYLKKKILFGVPTAIDAIRATKTIYMVEGYMDVVGLWQANVKNVLATCGTSVSDQHIQRMAQIGRRVKVLFDGDSAGREAAAKTFSLFLGAGLDAVALFLPTEDDPDSIARRLGQKTAEYLNSLEEIPLIDCFIDSLVRKQGVQDIKSLGAGAKGKVAETVVDAVAKVDNSVERNEIIRRAAFRLMLEPQELLSLLNPKISATKAIDVTSDTDKDSKANMATRKELEELPVIDRELLLAVMARKDSLADRVLRDSELCVGLDPLTIAFVTELSRVVSTEELKDSDKREEISQLLKSMGKSWVTHWRKAYAMERDKEVDFEKTFIECKLALKKALLNQEVMRIQRSISQAGSEAEKIELHGEMVSLRKHLSTVVS